MLEGSIMSMGKMYLSLFMIICLVSISCFFIAVGQANEFKEIVDHEIEIHGGLTQSAMTKIKDYNNNNFHGEFEISSSELGVKKSYGDSIEYQLNRPYKFLFINLSNDIICVKGTALSHAR